MIVGNKCDALREVKEEDAFEVAKRFNLPYFETSAKEDINITSAFDKLVSIIHSQEEKRNKIHNANNRGIELGKDIICLATSIKELFWYTVYGIHLYRIPGNIS